MQIYHYYYDVIYLGDVSFLGVAWRPQSLLVQLLCEHQDERAGRTGRLGGCVVGRWGIDPGSLAH